jgi:hypothetical protein
MGLDESIEIRSGLQCWPLDESALHRQHPRINMPDSA